MPQKPTAARCLQALVLVLVMARAVSAQHAPVPVSWTEREVVARALQRAPLTELIEGNVVIEEGRGRASSAYPNPQLSYVREQTFGSFGTGEDYLSVAQTVELGGRRRLYGEAFDARARAARSEGDATRISVAADARLRFYEVLYRQGRVAALDAWVLRLDQAIAIVMRLEQRGEVATYERRRLERERAVAMGRLETERAALDRARARLLALLVIGSDGGSVIVTGTLMPEDDPAGLQDSGTPNALRPDLLALDLRVEAASLERKAASRFWVPDLRLEGGWKGVNLGRQGRTDGFLLGVSLSVPLWDQSSGLAHVAEGEGRAAGARRALLQSELDGELGGARAETVRLRRAAAEFREQTTAVSSDLVRIASAGYEGGELGLLELLDAYRGAAEDSLSALDMEHTARRARIELDRLTGVGLP